MARKELLTTDTEDLQELLGNGKTYTVPPYQRDYSWKQEHWEDLWEDLLTADRESEDHYMGAIVLERGERKSFRIIDGQQRIATLSILILVCVDYLHGLAEEGIESEKNLERAEILEGGYLGTKDPVSLRISPKLKLNANDDDFFQLNIAQRKPPRGGVRTLRDSERSLWNCFVFFREKIGDRFSPRKSGEAVAKFVNEIVTQRLIFINVGVQDQLSAYTVFETLNARGLELTETDLLKNYLLSLAQRLSPSQMGPVLKRWNRVTARVGVNQFPQFLRHHLNSEREYVRQKDLFKTIKADIKDMRAMDVLLDRLEHNAIWFEALADPSSEFWLDYEGAKTHVRVLNLFNVSQYTPLIFAAKDRFKPQEIVEVLRCCAIISVRFNGVSRRSTHALEENYNQAALKVRGGEATDPAAVGRALNPIYIPDEEFEADFQTLRLKNHGTAGKRLRYFLAAIERHLGSRDVTDEVLTATVEHVLPENPGESGWEQFSPEAHERSYTRLGNYSLLEKKLNSRRAANDSFAEKRIVYQESDYRLSKKMAEYENWSEETIAHRQKAMARAAKSIWCLPAAEGFREDGAKLRGSSP